MNFIELRRYNFRKYTTINVNKIDIIQLCRCNGNYLIYIFLSNNKCIKSNLESDKNVMIEIYNSLINSLGKSIIQLKGFKKYCAINLKKINYVKPTRSKGNYYIQISLSNKIIKSKPNKNRSELLVIYDDLQNRLNKYDKNKFNKKIKNELKELKMMIEYMPNLGPKYFETKEHFESI